MDRVDKRKPRAVAGASLEVLSSIGRSVGGTLRDGIGLPNYKTHEKKKFPNKKPDR